MTAQERSKSIACPRTSWQKAEGLLSGLIVSLCTVWIPEAQGMVPCCTLAWQGWDCYLRREGSLITPGKEVGTLEQDGCRHRSCLPGEWATLCLKFCPSSPTSWLPFAFAFACDTLLSGKWQDWGGGAPLETLLSGATWLMWHNSILYPQQDPCHSSSHQPHTQESAITIRNSRNFQQVGNGTMDWNHIFRLGRRLSWWSIYHDSMMIWVQMPTTYIKIQVWHTYITLALKDGAWWTPSLLASQSSCNSELWVQWERLFKKKGGEWLKKDAQYWLLAFTWHTQICSLTYVRDCVHIPIPACTQSKAVLSWDVIRHCLKRPGLVFICHAY